MDQSTVDFVYNSGSSDENVSERLSRCDVLTLFEPDQYHLNILHHAILAKNKVIVSDMLLRLKQNQNAYNDVKLPYLHLAGMVGCPKVAEILCKSFAANQKVKNQQWWQAVEDCMSFGLTDLVVRHLDVKILEDLSEKFQLLSDEISRQSCDRMSAIDVAAVCKNVNCLKVFLNTVPLSRKTSSSFTLFDRANECHSSWALSCITESASESDLSTVFVSAVRQLRVDIVRRLLDSGRIKTKEIFSSSNPYHTACMLTSLVYNQPRYSGLDELVSLFIERGSDINICFPPGHYPLYSMIYSLIHEKDADPRGVPDHHIRSLRLMLKAGANPNFDEIRKSEEILPASERNKLLMMAPRDLYCSALDAYFSCLQSCDTWSTHVMEHLDQICLLLLEKGADACYRHFNQESPLHSLMRLAANQHVIGHLSADFSSMTRMLICFGADPDISPNEELSYPVRYYFVRIFNLMGGTFAYDRWRSSDAVAQASGLLTYMNLDDANKAFHLICHDVDRALEAGDGMTLEISSQVKSVLLQYLPRTRSLQEMCQLALWRAVGRKVQNLKHLHLPRSLLRDTKEFFALEI